MRKLTLTFLWACVFLGLTMTVAALAATPNTVPLPPLPNYFPPGYHTAPATVTWNQVYDSLSPGIKGFLASMAAFMGWCRMFSKPINARIQLFFDGLAAKHTSAIGSDFNVNMAKFFNWMPYLIFQFAADYLCSIKFPTQQSYMQEVVAQGKPKSPSLQPVAPEAAQAGEPPAPAPAPALKY